MTETLVAPLRGMHFHPPATTVLGLLAAGTELRLEPQPDNPFDGNAIKVMLHKDRLKALLSEDEAASTSMNSAFYACGIEAESFWDLDYDEGEGWAGEYCWLGFVGKEHCLSFLAAMTRPGAAPVALLGFTGDGKPTVTFAGASA